MTEKGYKPTHFTSQAGSDQPSEAIKSFHSQILHQAQTAL